MNIFKTLANGSGSINEPNVSAFLGYLLNPKEDHGLSDAFLRRFLAPLFEKNKLKSMEGRDLSIRSNFEFEVLLEQAFRKERGKRIVDIVILCYEKKVQKGRSLAEDIIIQKKEGKLEPKHIFLIENKINDASCIEGQLKGQFIQTIDRLKKFKIDNPEELVSVIYVTPNGEKCKKEFSEFGTDNNVHLFWNSAPKNEISIAAMIREIVEKVTPPIDIYCKYTLQAFLEFIENDFKSAIIEELEEKKRDFSHYDFARTPYRKPLAVTQENNSKSLIHKVENYGR